MGTADWRFDLYNFRAAPHLADRRHPMGDLDVGHVVRTARGC